MATHYFASHGGGIEIVAERLWREFSDAGHEVVWVAGDSTPPPPEYGKSRTLPIKVFNGVERKTGLPFPVPTIAALRMIESEVSRCDIVLLHDCLYLSNIAAFRKARRRGLLTIIVQHIGFVPYKNVVLNTLMHIANAAITRPMLRGASQVVFISETTRNYFTELRFKLPSQTIFNGVDTELYRPPVSVEEKTTCRERFNLPVDGPIVLFVGRFVEKKGLTILRRMTALRPEWVWAFAGWGPIDPRAWNANNVHVFSGLRGEAIAALYRACDVLVLPSVGEGFPLVIQEALASGLPVVCGTESVSADPPLSSVATGVAVNLEEPEQTAVAFIKAVNELLNSGAATSNTHLRRDFALQRYSWRGAAERYLAIATKLLSPAESEAAAESAGKR